MENPQDRLRHGAHAAGLGLPRIRLGCLNPELLDDHPAEFVANLAEGRTYQIGGDRRCDVALNASGVAAHHARLVPSPQHWRIAAVDDAPISVNGQRIAVADIRPGDQVTIGPLMFRIEKLADDWTGPDTVTRSSSRPPSRRTPSLALCGGVLIVLATFGTIVAWQFAGGPERAGKAPVPVADYRQILEGAAADMRILRYGGNDAILVFDFPTLADQGRMLNRIAALVEKVGAPRDRLLSDGELAAYIAASGTSVETFYYGHDYRADDLARFFTLAWTSSVTLNPDENRLRQILLDQGLIVEADDGFRAADGPHALVSIPQVQSDDPSTTDHWEGIDKELRDAILRHELSHGEYFTNVAYREHCVRFWNEGLTPAERQAVTAYLQQLGYEPDNEDLVINEMQAFLMHTPDPRIFGAADVGMSEQRLARVRAAFWAGNPPTGLLTGASSEVLAPE